MSARRIAEHRSAMRVAALYNYDAEEPDELSFVEGDELRVLHVQEDGWWYGSLVRDPECSGLFPSNYVQQIRDPEASSLSTSDDTQRHNNGTTSGRRSQSVVALKKNVEQAEEATRAAREARMRLEQQRLLRPRRDWRDDEGNDDDDEDDVGEDKDVLDVRDRRQSDNHRNAAEWRNKSRTDRNNDVEDRDDMSDDDRPARNRHFKDTHGEQGEDEEEDIYLARNKNAAFTVPLRDKGRMNRVIEAYKSKSSQHHGRKARYYEDEENEDAYDADEQRDDGEDDEDSFYARKRALAPNNINSQANADGAADPQFRRAASRIIFDLLRKNAQRSRQRHDLEQQLENQKVAGQAILRWVLQTRSEKRRQATARAEQQRARNRMAAVVIIQRYCREFIRRRRRRKEVEQARRRQASKRAVAEATANTITKTATTSPPVLASVPVVHETREADKERRKVMKKEVVELVKAVVRKQLKEKMLEHDERLAELQRLVTNLQDVIRQQSVMLQESANQLLAFEQSKQQKSPKSVTKDSFIPRPPAIASTHSRSSLLPSVGAAVPNTGATVRPSGIKPPRSSERLSRLPAPSNNHGNHGTMATSKSTTSSTSSLGYAKR